MKTTPLSRKAFEYAIPKIESHCHTYQFHNEKHTKSVFERSTYLGMNIGISPEDLEDLQIASAFHDIWFLEQYAKNEYIWSQIARKWLEKMGHNEERIRKIENIIMATVLFSKPKTLLEEIIQDSDLDNIWTTSAFKNSQALEIEIREHSWIEMLECAFWQFTYRVYTNFNFNTEIAKKERLNQKKLNIELLEAYLKMLSCEVPYPYDHIEKII